MSEHARNDVRKHAQRRRALRCFAGLLVLGLSAGSPAMAATEAASVIRMATDAPGVPVRGNVYKMVFDMNTPNDPARHLNPGLKGLSDLIAEYESYGTDAAHRSIVVVLHGAYAELALTNARYRELRGGNDNPALPQMQALQRQGVVFTVPAAELAPLATGDADIQPGIKAGPRAEFAFLNLESSGHVYDGMKSLVTP